MLINDFLPRLKGVTGHDSQWSALCPAHDDHNRSLSIGRGDKGGIVLTCHAGCSQQDVVAAMVLTMADLAPDKHDTGTLDWNAEIGSKKAEKLTLEATYDYHDADGKLLYQVLRYRQHDGNKTFRGRQPDGKGGWAYNLKGISLIPYNLPAVLNSNVVFIVEGEKDVETLRKHNVIASCNPHGAGKWRAHYNDWFRKKVVLIVQDNDDTGKKHAADVAANLKGVAVSVKVIDLTRIDPALPGKSDITDLIERIGADKALGQPGKLSPDTPEWEPEKSPTQDKPVARIVKASDVPYEPPRWLIPPYFQRGKGTMIQADNGTGKTAFTCAIAAHISTGRPLLDIPIEAPGDALILSVEDDLPVLRGRIEASGGDLTKCHFLTNAAGLTFNSPEVEEAIKQISAKMVIFDPFQAFLGASVNMDKSNQTRPELAKLFEMADRNDCSVVIIAHIGKGSAFSSAVNRSLGSVDIPSAMRSILQLTRNPDDETECIAVHVKCSNAPKGRSLSFTIGDRGGVSWNGYSAMTADDLTTLVKRKEKGIPYENEPLVQVFNQLITDRPGGGFWSYSDLKSEGAKILGFPPYSDINDLRTKLDKSLAREMQEHDGLIVTHSAKGTGNVRGIRIEQYQHPQGYQTTMQS